MRALIVSDIHGNLEALQAVLAAAAGEYDELWNLGDVVGYGGSPNQVLDLLRPIVTLSVRGNHDRVCCGLTSSHGFNPVARAAATWTQHELTADHLLWLRSVEQGPLHPAQQPGVSCAHGSPLDEDHYILNMRDAWAPLQQMTTALTFFGHTHVQGGFAQMAHNWHELRPGMASGARGSQAMRNEAVVSTLTLAPAMRYLINPGSVGQPRDCDWRAGFAIYDTEAATIDFHRIPYDLTAAQGRILMTGLPERLAARLREGR